MKIIIGSSYAAPELLPLPRLAHAPEEEPWPDNPLLAEELLPFFRFAATPRGVA